MDCLPWTVVLGENKAITLLFLHGTEVLTPKEYYYYCFVLFFVVCFFVFNYPISA